MDQNDSFFPTRKDELILFLERFVPTFSRFFLGELNVKPSIYLSSVEEGLENVSQAAEQVYFGASSGVQTVFLGISRPFISGVIDFLLGSGQFNPDYDTESWSNLDESLAAPFVAHLLEVFSGYCGNFALDKDTVLGSSPDAISCTCDVWYKIDWIVEIETNSFLFTFLLPNFARSDFQSKAYNEQMKPTEEKDILDYIKMCRSSLKQSHHAAKKTLREKESEMLTLRIRIGSFDLKSGNIHLMKPGDLLATDISAGSSFHLVLGGESLCSVTPGEKNGNKAVIIE